MPSYYGDVEVIVRMRLRIDANASEVNPTTHEMFNIISSASYDDIHDEEQLEILAVLEVGSNAAE